VGADVRQEEWSDERSRRLGGGGEGEEVLGSLQRYEAEALLQAEEREHSRERANERLREREREEERLEMGRKCGDLEKERSEVQRGMEELGRGRQEALLEREHMQMLRDQVCVCV